MEGKTRVRVMTGVRVPEEILEKVRMRDKETAHKHKSTAILYPWMTSR